MGGLDFPASSQKNWLVKSSARILGPFTLQDLADNLRQKNISIIDELRLPTGRWTYIRENPRLLEVIRQIRDEEDPHSEKTMTQSLAQHTVTRTDAYHPEDVTPVPVKDSSPGASLGASNLKDIAASEIVVPRTNPGMNSTKSYGVSGDARVQARIARKSKTLQNLIIGATIVIAGVVAWNLNSRNLAQGSGYEELRAATIRYKSLGLFQKALQTYQRASQLKEPDSEFAVEMAPVLISEDRQTIQGRRVLENVLGQEGRSRSAVMDAYLGVALSYMLEGDVQQAEQALQKALGQEPANFSALLNLAILQLRKGRWGEASRAFDELYRRNSKSSLALLGRGMADLEFARQSQQTVHLSRLQKDIEAHIQKNAFLRQELTLLRAYSFKLQGDVDALNQAVVQFLSFLPGEAKLYSHPLLVDWRFSRWDVLEKFCQYTYPEQSPHAGFKAMRAICFMENNRDSEASRLLQESKAEAPKDPYILQAEAAYLMKVSRLPEALALLKMPELTTLTGKNALLGRYCIQQKDIACVKASANQLLQSDPRSVEGNYGLAWVSAQKKDRAKAYDYVRTGLEIEPLYLPLLELRDTLEAR